MSEIETQRLEPASPAALADPPDAAPTPVADPTVRFGHSRPVNAQKLTRRGRVRKWDREPHPHDWRFYIGTVGKTLIAIGLLMFGFVGYQLYGTAIETAAAQSELTDQFEEQLALVEPVSPDFAEGEDSGPVVEADPTSDDGDIADPSEAVVVIPDEDEPIAAAPDVDPIAPIDEAVALAAVPVEAQNIPIDVQNGDALAKIEIPRIGVNDIVVAGVDTGDLKRGPGHFPDTPLPGQLGNAAIAGHRTTYGQPFRNVDKLQVGDEIRMTTLSGVFVYKVTGQAIVEPSDYQVVATTDPTVANLTLTSCHPVFTARQRIVIFSELDRTESAPVGEPVINYGRTEAAEAPPELPAEPDSAIEPIEQDAAIEPTDEVVDTVEPAAPADDAISIEPSVDDPPVAADELGSEAVNEGIADAFSDGWFSDPGANLQVGLWGVVLGAIAIAAYAISRRFRRDLAGLAIGLIPFAMALYFFFQNVNRLLPPNL